MPGNYPIYGFCIVHAVDSTQLRYPLVMDAVWIVKDQEVWKSWLVVDQALDDPKGISIGRSFRGGPEWAPHNMVDVVVRLQSDEGTMLLRAANQYIGAIIHMSDSTTSHK